jgi:hypothetical protein
MPETGEMSLKLSGKFSNSKVMPDPKLPDIPDLESHPLSKLLFIRFRNLSFIKISPALVLKTGNFSYRKSPNFDHQTELRPLLSYLLHNHLCTQKSFKKNGLIVK